MDGGGKGGEEGKGREEGREVEGGVLQHQGLVSLGKTLPDRQIYLSIYLSAAQTFMGNIKTNCHHHSVDQIWLISTKRLSSC